MKRTVSALFAVWACLPVIVHAVTWDRVLKNGHAILEIDKDGISYDGSRRTYWVRIFSDTSPFTNSVLFYYTTDCVKHLVAGQSSSQVGETPALRPYEPNSTDELISTKACSYKKYIIF